MPVTRLLYPFYQLGNPQLRLFRPNWFLTLVRPGKEQPPDTVQFRVPMEMTKYDVKNYLEKIYNVPVGDVRTRIQFGSNKKRNHLNQRVKQPDYKVAYVQLTLHFSLKARRSAFLISSQQRPARQQRVPWRRFRRSSWRTKSRGRNLTRGEEGSRSGSDSEAAHLLGTLCLCVCVWVGGCFIGRNTLKKRLLGCRFYSFSAYIAHKRTGLFVCVRHFFGRPVAGARTESPGGGKCVS
ncbi:large ribosomal subunit protein uL23m isoform X1 [Phyllopteryx taeniolatus]|uniref:large ribosomal subunit protein uL23m isoform X1 n=1 Tax=Phyllopteryx taeniolatus TaxID=161469 RepID=UPI002AD37A1F|nr:large ribosomal subunit protein uL23m isoform X1 [Phyllopteryx taeniolatus]